MKELEWKQLMDWLEAEMIKEAQQPRKPLTFTTNETGMKIWNKVMKDEAKRLNDENSSD